MWHMSDPDDNTAKENEEFVSDLLAAGWKHTNDNMIVHPGDPDINVFFNPYSKELLLSPKLVLALKNQAQAEQGK